MTTTGADQWWWAVAGVCTALVAAIPPTLAVILAARKNKTAVQEVHLSLNSRLDRLLDEVETRSHAEGVVEGKASAE